MTQDSAATQLPQRTEKCAPFFAGFFARGGEADYNRGFATTREPF
jgi:hypothetical protein